MSNFIRKYAEVQNLPGLVIFYTEFLLTVGIPADSNYKYTALTVEQARALNLL